MKFIQTIQKDHMRYAKFCGLKDGGTFLGVVRMLLFPKGMTFPFVFWLRVVQKFKSKRCLFLFCPVSVLFFRHFEFKYGIHVNSSTEIGEGLFVVHGDGVYINCRSVGKNLTIYQNATLGEGNKPYGIPTVKDNVTVYAGAIVCGEIVIGNDCTIGANSFVKCDIKDGATMAGNPARYLD